MEVQILAQISNLITDDSLSLGYYHLSYKLNMKSVDNNSTKSVVQYNFYIQNMDQFRQTNLYKMNSLNHTQKNRANRIKDIKNSLKDFTLISKNKSMIQKKISLQNQNLSQNTSNDGFSLENEENTIFTPNQHTEIFAEKYQIISKLGQGSDGVVHRCIKKRSGGEYAVKSFIFDEQHIPQIRSNFVLVKGLEHHSIIEYEALYLDLKKHACWLVMELFQHPSLDKISIGSQNQLREIIHQLLQALHFLHQHAVSHRDIKEENILYDPVNKHLKLIDYGICRKHRRRGIKFQMLTITGTLYYRAPEMFMGGGYNEKVDIWSTGITIYKLITGRTPFQSEYHSSTINNILTSQLEFTSEFDCYSTSLKNLIGKMLQKDPNKRVSALDCLKDIWFQVPNSSPKNFIFDQNWNELYLQGMKSPMIDSIDQKSYIRKINGDEYHCFDSDDQGVRKGVGVKRIHRSVTMEVGSHSLSKFSL